MHTVAERAGSGASIMPPTGTEETPSVQVLRARWRSALAKADLCEPDDVESERRLSKLIDEHNELAALTMRARPQNLADVLAKLDILQWVLSDQHETGVFNDCRDVAMAGAIRADILRLLKDHSASGGKADLKL